MQIGIDIRCLMHKNYSGVAEYAFNLLDNLFRLDRQNQYKLFYNCRKDISNDLPRFNYSNVKFYPWRWPNKLFNFSLRFLHYPQLDKLLKGADIFFLPNLNFCHLSRQCLSIITAHDLSFIKYPSFFSCKQRLWQRLIQPQKIFKQAKIIIADSQSTKNDLQKIFKIAPEKIQVISLGVDTNFFRPLPADEPNLKLVRKKYSLPENFILALSTLEPRKNLEGLIEAFNLLKEDPKFSALELIIAGATGWHCKGLIKLAQKSKFKQQLRFLGYIDPKDKPYLYNLSQVFVFGSFYEGFGLPVLEAQACGIPIIAGLNSSLPEIVADSGLLFNPENIQELQQALISILDNPAQAEILKLRGLANCQKYSWQQCASQTLKCFTEIGVNK